MSAWDVAFEREGHRLVGVVCSAADAAARDRAWRELLAQIAPAIERWAATSAALRRVGLTGEDEARAVLVEVFDRMRRNDFANLRAFLAHQPPDAAEQADAAMVEGLARLAAVESPVEEGPAAGEDHVTGTPLRGWLRALTRFAVKEHVLRRFGWRAVARWVAVVEPAPDAALLAAVRALPGVVHVDHDAATGRLAIDHRPAQVRPAVIERALTGAGLELRRAAVPLSKRDLGSGAERLDAVTERGERPPLSTLLGVREALGEIRAYMAGFPGPMRRALELWLADTELEAIAAELTLADAGAARALVRAGTARLRERFRGSWPELFDSA